MSDQTEYQTDGETVRSVLEPEYMMSLYYATWTTVFCNFQQKVNDIIKIKIFNLYQTKVYSFHNETCALIFFPEKFEFSIY